ncbi:MAG: hypothetical protein V7K23_28960 [Nostoc sp.]
MGFAGRNQEAVASTQQNLVLTCPDRELPGQQVELFEIAPVAMGGVCVPGGK